jgi:hypothetical protein
MGRRAAGALRSLRQATLCQIEQRFAHALPPALLAQNAEDAHSRERVFTLARTFWGWLWQVLQAHTSCREVVRQVQALFALHEAARVDGSTGAYCQARSKLSESLLTKLFAVSFQSAEKAAHSLAKPLLAGRSIRVVDGSGSRLADTKANRSAYPPSSNMVPGTGFPFLRVVVLFSMVSGALLAQASGSLLVSELRLWLDLLPALRPGDILLADRAYGLFVVAALLQGARVDLISAISGARKVHYRKAKKRFGSNDALFLWEKKSSHPSAFLERDAWDRLPQQLEVRILRARIERPGMRTKHFRIVTTLLDPKTYPANEIIAAYARRWRMEMCFDDLKTTLGMENLRTHKPQMVRKELLVFLIAHNLIRCMMAQAATQEEADLDRVSFKGALDGLRQWGQAIAQSGPEKGRRAKLWHELLRIIVADALPFRPGRREPRAVKKRCKYPYLNQPRHKYRSRPNRNKRRTATTARRKASLN